MPVPGGAFIQGYNAQLAVSADHLIVAVRRGRRPPATKNQLEPMLAHLDEAVAMLRESNDNPNLAVGTALFDAGYDNETTTCTAPGANRLIALGKRARTAGERPPSTPPAADATRPRPHGLAAVHTRRRRSPLQETRRHRRTPQRTSPKTAAAYADSARRGHTAAKAELALASLLSS